MFGNFIKQQRVKLGLTLQNVANNLNIDTSTLSKIEKEDRTFPRYLLEDLASILDIKKKEVYNQYFTSKIVTNIKDYPNYKEVLNMVSNHLDSNTPPQLTLPYKTDNQWLNKPFSNPNTTVKVLLLFMVKRRRKVIAMKSNVVYTKLYIL